MRTLVSTLCVGSVLLILALAASGCAKKQAQTAGRPAGRQAERQAQAPPANPYSPQFDVQDRSNPMPTGATWVHADKVQYRVGETMQIEYKVQAGATGKPWVGLIPVSVQALDEGTNDASDAAYAYIDAARGAQGKVELRAGKKGDYFLRLFGSDSDPAAACQGQTPLTAVRDWPQGHLIGHEGLKPCIMFEGQKLTVSEQLPEPVKFKAGGTLKGTYELAEAYPSDAWIGLIPWAVKNRGEEANDAADVAYKYLEQGVLQASFELPLAEPGEYVVRLFPCSFGDAAATFQSVKIIVE